jgi:pimeloyl-ACP methyl ester carboxylesterase
MSADGSGTTKPSIVLIHGLWLTPRSWSGWIAHYRRAGFEVIAPSWPGLEGEVEAIRLDPSPLRGLKVKTIVDHYGRIIRQLDVPPILMGHSFGGLFVQMLLDRGLGAAGVAIDSAQPAGVLVLPWSTVRSGFAILGNPFTFNAAVPITPEQFNYAFTNELGPIASQMVYDRLAIPAAARVLWEGALSLLNPYGATRVDFRNDERAPLLLIAGEKDHVAPPSVNRANLRKYAHSTAVTDYKEFPGRTHHTVGQHGWEEVADYALDWAVRHARTAKSSAMPVLVEQRSP